MTRRAVWKLAVAGALRAAGDLTRLLDDLAKPLGGELGFAMLHLENGERVALRGDERFPMASVYKLPIAIEVLHQVDAGKLSLGQTVRLGPGDLRLGMGTDEVARLVGTAGHDFTVGELLERTLVDSDNASSDALLGLTGAAAVTERMAALGAAGIRVDRPEVELLLHYVGVSSTAPPEGWTLETLRERYRAATPERRRAAQRAFLADPRDTATPNAMVDLLARVHRREVLGKQSGEKLVDAMRRCRTGANRLRGNLPRDVVFAHRTGTTDTTDGVTAGTNDVGILTLPGGAGHVAMAAFLRMARGTMEERERVLAKAGRTVWERYVGA